MDIKEVDKSILNIEIIFSLIDGNTKSANTIASEYKKTYQENDYRKKCNHLSKEGILTAHPLEKREGYERIIL